MLSESLPVPMGDWDTSVTYEFEYTNDVEEKIKEQVSDPSDWHLKGKSRSCGISASFLASPVKKRSFAELSAMTSAVNSPSKLNQVRPVHLNLLHLYLDRLCFLARSSVNVL